MRGRSGSAKPHERPCNAKTFGIFLCLFGHELESLKRFNYTPSVYLHVPYSDTLPEIFVTF
jgi:hypothetical protein